VVYIPVFQQAAAFQTFPVQGIFWCVAWKDAPFPVLL